MNKHFHGQHVQMMAFAEEIIQLAKAGSDDAGATLNTLRLGLSRAVTTHCAEEARVLAARDSLLPRDIVRRYHDELLKWRMDLIACNTAWPPKAVWNDRAGFVRAFTPIATALAERLRWEESELYPALAAV